MGFRKLWISPWKKTNFLKLEEDQPNELIFYAKNLGRISPNTTAITLIDKNEKKEFEINSNLDENGKITLFKNNSKGYLLEINFY